MAKLYDISRAMHAEMAVWPGDPGFELQRTGKIADGSAVNVSALNMGAHTGTHVDALRPWIGHTPKELDAVVEMIDEEAGAAMRRNVVGA